LDEITDEVNTIMPTMNDDIIEAIANKVKNNLLHHLFKFAGHKYKLISDALAERIKVDIKTKLGEMSLTEMQSDWIRDNRELAINSMAGEFKTSREGFNLVSGYGVFPTELTKLYYDIMDMRVGKFIFDYLANNNSIVAGTAFLVTGCPCCRGAIPCVKDSTNLEKVSYKDFIVRLRHIHDKANPDKHEAALTELESKSTEQVIQLRTARNPVVRFLGTTEQDTRSWKLSLQLTKELIENSKDNTEKIQPLRNSH